MGRVNATAPFGVLELDEGHIEVRLRPRFLAWVFGVDEPLTARPTDGVEAFPARGWFSRSGVGVLVNGRPPSYFWTRQRSDVLAALASAGVTVDWKERRVKY
jgi:hypothetical protein